MSSDNTSEHLMFPVKTEAAEESEIHDIQIEHESVIDLKDDFQGFDDVKRETKPQGDQKYNIIDGYVDSATLESIAKAIPSSISDSPSYSSSVKKVASETQTSGNRAEKRKREDCPQCTERKKFKRSLKIKQLQLLNYKTKLDIINLERKLGIKQSIFENENVGLSEDWIITMDCVKV